jgi:hypothetical protein
VQGRSVSVTRLLVSTSFRIARHSDNIHFGQGRASRIRFSGEISNQESEDASARLGSEKRLHVSVFQRESADKYAAQGGTTRPT